VALATMRVAPDFGTVALRRRAPGASMPNMPADFRGALPPADPDLHIAPVPAHMGAGLRIRGELDLAAVPPLRTAVSSLCRSRTPDAELFVLDLTAVTFMDSAGLHALNDVQVRLAERGWMLRVIPPRAEAPAWLLQVAAGLGWLVLLRS
jgi:anti-anti-sigma factor